MINGIQRGAVIHHQDQVIIPISFSVKNIKKSNVENDIPLQLIVKFLLLYIPIARF